ncbi:MAG: hypothetical protein WC273_00365 [Dehalococcoidia bacterium]
MAARVLLPHVRDDAEVEAAADDVLHGEPGEGVPSAGSVALGVEPLRDRPVGLPARTALEGATHGLGRVLVHDGRSGLVAVAEGRQPDGLSPAGALGQRLRDVLPQQVRGELVRSGHHRQRHLPDWRGEVHALHQRDEADIRLPQPGQRVPLDPAVPGPTAQLVNDDHVEPPTLGVGQQAGEGGALRDHVRVRAHALVGVDLDQVVPLARTCLFDGAALRRQRQAVDLHLRTHPHVPRCSHAAWSFRSRSACSRSAIAAATRPTVRARVSTAERTTAGGW